MSEEKKDNRPTKNQLKLEKQFKVCKWGYNCWKRYGFSCCPGCAAVVREEHYPESIVENGEWKGKEPQTCGCVR
jgi:hypothetical protein